MNWHAPGSTDPPPTLSQFVSWSPSEVQPLTQNKTVVFSPGGSSRWYFLEHGDASQGYDEAAQFRDYSRRTLRRILELADMMFDDGLRTVFVVGMTPRQSSRTAKYNQNLAQSLAMLADEDAQELYARYQMGVLFRGGWQAAFERLGVAHLLSRCEEVERQTASERERWLVWVAEDEPLPRSLVPLLTRTLEKTGHMPDRAALCEAYYGRPLTHADIFLGNNKPTIEGQLPPLLTVGDLYFTVNMCFYMDRQQWRSILYDHLFARRGSYRDYTAMDAATIEELRSFYQAHQGITLGVGTHDDASQTWRPIIPPSLRPSGNGS